MLDERAYLVLRAQEDRHLVAKRLGEPLLDPAGQRGGGLAPGAEGDVAARTKGGHVVEAEALEQLAQLGAPSLAGMARG